MLPVRAAPLSVLEVAPMSVARRRRRVALTPVRAGRVVADPLEPRTLLSATVTATVPAQTLTAGQTPAAISLASYFDDPTIPAGDTAVDMQTNLPAPDNSIPLYLTNAATPQTVANFLAYITNGEYAGTVIHRSVPGFIIQGGGFTTAGTAITSLGTIPGESATATLTNTTGTIAVALSDGPDSGTDNWFFNLANNDGTTPGNPNLDDTSDGGPFTAFGKVVYDGLTVLDDIADLPIVNDTDQAGGAWGSLPVQAGTLANGSTEATVPATDLITINPVVVPGGLTYTAISSNPALVAPTVSDGDLSLNPVAGATGTAQVTVTATDLGGITATQTFAVTVDTANPTSTILAALPAAAQTAPAGTATPFALGTLVEKGATPPYTVTVDWGDGTTATTFTATADGTIPAQSHTYAAAGTDTVSVTVADSAGNTSDPATFTATVSPAVASLAVTPPAAQTALAGAPASIAVGSFAETNATAPFTVTVDWGDGTADTTVAATAAGVIPAQVHTYAAAGTDTVSVTVADSAGNTSTSAMFAVAVAAPTGLVPTLAKTTVPTTAVTGATVKGSATFSLTNATATTDQGTNGIALYATTAGEIAPGQGTLVGSAKLRLALKAGGTAKVTVPVRAASLADGTYTLVAVTTNASGKVVATAGPTLTVAAPTVLLSATVTATPADVAAGKSVTFALALTNAGNVASTGRATIVLVLAADGSTPSIALGTVTRSVTIKPGGKPLVLRLTAKVSAFQATGTFTPQVTFTQPDGAATAAGTSPVNVG